MENKMACDVCGLLILRANILRHKKEQQGGGKKFPCKKCGKRFDKSWNRNRHEEKCENLIGEYSFFVVLLVQIRY